MGKYAFSLVRDVFKYANNGTGKDKGHKPSMLQRQENLGLNENFDGKRGLFDGNNSQPWARIRAYVDDLNSKKAGPKFKAIFVLRHGYSLHNYVEKGVKGKGKDNWRVSYPPVQLNHFREATNSYGGILGR